MNITPQQVAVITQVMQGYPNLEIVETGDDDEPE
jgi:hypothetical protein